MIQYIKDFPTELKRSDLGDLRVLIHVHIEKKKMNTMAKFTKLVWLAAVKYSPLCLLFFMVSKHKKEREENCLKAIFQKE